MIAGLRSRGLLPLVVMALLMAAASALAYAVRPIYKLADQRPRVQLETLIPREFDGWRTVNIGSLVIPNPQAQETLERIYTQTLTRTYTNARGEVVMLSIAYGDDQRAAMAVHYPEVCYPAQGFSVASNVKGQIETAAGTIPVRRLETSLSRQRYEPVTYWTTIGDEVSLGGVEKRLIELRYGVRRQIPDGMLVRASSIDRDSARAFALQERFLRDLVRHLDGDARTWIAGRPTVKSGL